MNCQSEISNFTMNALIFLTGCTQNTLFPVLNILLLNIQDVLCMAMTLESMEITLQAMPAVIVVVERSAPILKVGSILEAMIVLGTASSTIQVVLGMGLITPIQMVSRQMMHVAIVKQRSMVRDYISI